MPDEPLILGIETSCDETGVGIVHGNRLLANALASSMDEHAKYGGVVPEVAARAHLESIGQVLDKALAEAGISIDRVDAIAVANGPGLAGALMVGIGAAKGLSVAHNIPIYAVNHLVGHVGADVLERGSVQLPTIALLVSGGHTSLLLVRDLLDDVELLGETIDDAAGEAFDKIARILELGFPGGPAIDREAKSGNPDAIEFPRGLTLARDLVDHKYDFSFSGLKTAVSRYLAKTPNYLRADVAASFQEAVVDVLLMKAIGAAKESGIETLIIAGGVAANSRLGDLASERATKAGIQLRIPPMDLCTDNGAMVAAIGSLAVAKGLKPSQIGFAADSSSGISKPIF